MKLFLLRLSVLIACLVLISNIAMAQSNKLKMHSISIGAGIASSSSDSAESGSSLNLDISTIVHTHIISFYLNTGITLNPGGPGEDFSEFNLTYGRKWSLAQNLSLEGHLGFGLFLYKIDTGSNIIFPDLPESTIGFPVRAKIIYSLTDNFGIGINPNANFNSIETAYSANFILQYNFD